MFLKYFNRNGTYECSASEMQHVSSPHSSCLPNYCLQNVGSFFRNGAHLFPSQEEISQLSFILD